MRIVKHLLLAASVAGAVHSTSVIACNAEPFLAEVCPVAFNFAPRGWAFTHGQLLAVSQNDALFSVIGTIYGGDGRTTFALPDTRGRVVIGAGQGLGLQNYPLGAKGGVENVTLTVANMPSHSHIANTAVNASTSIDVAAQLQASTGSGNQVAPTGNYLAKSPGTNNIYRSYDANLPQVSMSAGSVAYNLALPLTINASATTADTSNTGGTQSHTNLAPTLGLNWVIALQGVFPSRN